MLGKRVIAICAYNRPDYLQKVLISIRANDLTGYTLLVSIDPGCLVVEQIARQINFIPAHVVVNKVQLGCSEHHYRMIRYMLDAGVEEVILIEDDVMLSPDATVLANWFFALPDTNDYFNMSLFRRGSDRTRPNEVNSFVAFISFGFCATAACLRQILAARTDLVSWAHNANNYVISRQLLSLHPRLSRCTHIGRIGTHITAAENDAEFSNAAWSAGSGHPDFFTAPMKLLE